MRKVTLGRTGLMVSRLGLGTDVLHAGGLSVEEHTAIILRAWELGINLIDTDRWYDTYPSIAAALPHKARQDVVLVSKTYEKTRDGALADVAFALEALRYLYGLPAIHAVVPGIRSIAQLEHCVPVVEALDG